MRDRLAKFLADTERYGLPAQDSQITAEISVLMISFRSARTISAAEASVTAAAYLDILKGLPLWAVRSGLRKVRLGEAEGVSLDFPPAAPRLRKVVTDEMVPLRADRIEIERVLAAREVPPENPVMAKRVTDLVEPKLNPMQQKYGPSYGLGHILPAGESGEFGTSPQSAKSVSDFKALHGEALVEYYRNHGLGGTLKSETHSIKAQEDVAGSDNGCEEMRR